MIEKVIPIYPSEKFESNGYIAINGKTALIIDAPTTAVSAAKQFIEAGGKVEAILITHGHFDHIEGLPELAEVTGAPVYISAYDERKLWDDRDNRAIFHFDGEFPHYKGYINRLEGGERLIFECAVIDCMPYPGHTAGCIAYIADKKQCFSGDFVFKQGIGRTDFEDSNQEDMENSLYSFKSIPDNLLIYPGHGPETTLDNERKYL
jgi:glyoxylase-like metal-dependent hydrolase (beta-lactamase superfamily II)